MESTTLDEKEPIEDEDLPRLSSYSLASSASAVSELSFEDPRNVDRNDPDYGLSKRDLAEAEESVIDTNDDPRVGSYALQSPPSQVMERTPETSGYRIPSHVFARKKSNTLNPEWSTCSNESLFSIHTGNMSFTRDQYNWMFKSGELGMYEPDMFKSGEFDLGKVSDLYRSGELGPPSPQIVHKTSEPKIKDAFASGESPAESTQVIKLEQETPGHVKNSYNSPQVLEASEVSDAVKTPPRASKDSLDSGVPNKNEGLKRNDQKGGKLSVEEIRLSASVSHHSNVSTQSFAFPMLGEIDGKESVNSKRNQVDKANKSSAKATKEE